MKNSQDGTFVNSIFKRKDIKQSGLLYKIGNTSDKTISIIASLAMGIMIIVPAIVAIYSFFVRNFDKFFILDWAIIIVGVFPAVSIIAFILYIIVFLKVRNENKGILYHLKKNPVFIIFSIALILMIISQFYNGMESTVDGVTDMLLGESFDMQYSYFLFVLFAATQVRLESHKRLLIRVWAIVSMIVVVAAFVLRFTPTGRIYYQCWSETFSSVFTNTNYYGYYLAVSVPLMAASFICENKITWKILTGFSFVANTVVLSLNTSMGSWIGAAFAIVFIVISRIIIEKKINKQVIAVVIAFILCMYIPAQISGALNDNFSQLGGDISNIMEGGEAAEFAGSGRWRVWTASMDIIMENKLFGIGFDGVNVRGYIGAPYNTRPHNEFMQYAMFYGIPMAAFYFAGCLGVFLRALKKKKSLNGATLACLSGAFGYLVGSFFGLTVFSTAMYLFVFLGMGYVRNEETVCQ